MAPPLEQPPAWLVDLLDPPAAPELERAEWTSKRITANHDRYALRALEAELSAAPSGRRNDQLNKSAPALFRLAHDCRLHADLIEGGDTSWLHVERIAVTEAQIEAWNLPTRLSKIEGNVHARGWGERPSVELDAIPAHLPVARLGLPAAVAPPVSSGPSKGERAWRHGTNAPPAYRPNQRQAEVAE